MVIQEQGGTLILPPDCPRDDRSAGTEEAYQSPAWIELEAPTFECWVCLVPEEDGGYSVYLPSLPGVASQGETEEEALSNIKEAFCGVVEMYRDSGQPIPWCREAIPTPNNAKERWILVHV